MGCILSLKINSMDAIVAEAANAMKPIGQSIKKGEWAVSYGLFQGDELQGVC